MTTTATSSSKKRPRPLSSLPPPPAIPCLSSPFPSPPSFHNTYLKPHRPCVLKQAGPSLLPKALALLSGQQGEAEGVAERLKAILGPELGRSTESALLPPSLTLSSILFKNRSLALLPSILNPSLPPSLRPALDVSCVPKGESFSGATHKAQSVPLSLPSLLRFFLLAASDKTKKEEGGREGRKAALTGLTSTWRRRLCMSEKRRGRKRRG